VTGNLPGLPEWIQINSIEASPFDAGTAYVAATMYKSDDFRPYLYKTVDYGKTWKKIVRGIPETTFTRVIREDPHRRGLLYAGTETGMYVSFNDGESWQSLQLNLPVVPITDLAVHAREKDLVVATQGRSFWILDDLPVLHQWKDDLAAAEAHLFQPEDAIRMPGRGFRPPSTAVIGQNPPAGAVIWYYLKETPTGEVKLEILDRAGKPIRSFSSRPTEEGSGAAPAGRSGAAGPTRVETQPGLHQFVWDLRYPDASRFPGMILWAGMTSGPKAVPGTYQVRLTTGSKVLTQPLVVKADPRIPTTAQEFQQQFDLLLRIRDKLTETHDSIVSIRDVRRQVNDYADRVRSQPSAKPIVEAAQALSGKLTEIEEELYQTKNQSSQDPLNYPIRLNNKLAALAGSIAGPDARPTDQQIAVCDDLVARIDAQLARLRQLIAADLLAFNKLVWD
jgi:hypothetical protein